MYTFSKCKVKHLLLSMCALPPIRLDRGPSTVRSVTGRMCPRSKDCAPIGGLQKAPTVIYTAGASEKWNLMCAQNTTHKRIYDTKGAQPAGALLLLNILS